MGEEDSRSAEAVRQRFNFGSVPEDQLKFVAYYTVSLPDDGGRLERNHAFSDYDEHCARDTAESHRQFLEDEKYKGSKAWLSGLVEVKPVHLKTKDLRRTACELDCSGCGEEKKRG